MKSQNSVEKRPSSGSAGGTSCTMRESTSKSVLQFKYGNRPSAISTSVMPSDHTSARMSYSGFCGSGGSMRSGCVQQTFGYFKCKGLLNSRNE